MKLSRDYAKEGWVDYKVLEGDIVGAKYTDEGNAELQIETYANATPYILELKPQDIENMKLLLQNLGPVGGML